MTKKFTIVGVVVAVVLSLFAVFKPATIKEFVENPTGAIEFNTGRTTYSQLADSVLQEKIVTVASSSVKSIADFPVLLLPAVGAGRVNEIVSITGYRDFSSESFGYSQVGSDDREGFEVKWVPGQIANTASGLNGFLALGGSFSRGFISGGNGESRASRSTEYWVPSVPLNFGPIDTIGASESYILPVLASQSAVYLTASTAFTDASNQAQGNFIFRIIYRILRFEN